MSTASEKSISNSFWI